ncbi:MAG TPA: 3-dehydroquinate synthase family protein [Thermoanaerobaculia bacterium]|nr:3-dehydroquinate synthase family protein [Thermoanaerobaculia bacterium]
MSRPSVERIPVGSDSTVFLGAGLLADAATYLESPSGRFVLISSRNAGEAAGAIRRALAGRLLADETLDDREEAKTLSAVGRLADAALAAGLRRDDAIVAVGGGVTSDVAGFAAAILLRGVAWNAVPTTTGAMADAAIGGKTGVDHAAGKNLLGAFHPPRVILIDPTAAATLPDRDYRAGLVEAFKAAWIADADLAGAIERGVEAILAREPDALLACIAGAVRVKARIVTSDPREGDRRRLLNFGHTLGHAFEAAGGFRELKHGEAVAWGIAAALEISRRRAGLAEGEAGRVRSALARLGPFPAPLRDPAVLAPFLARDKKATALGIAGVLLETAGRARVEEAVPEREWLEAAAIMSLS